MAARAVSPTSEEIVRHIRGLRRSHPDLVKVSKLGETREGRPLHAVTITNPEAPARDKQHVLITAGHHGNEESGRLVALAAMDMVSVASVTREEGRVVDEEREPGMRVYVTLRRVMVPGMLLPPTEPGPLKGEIETPKR